jgi:hypothetical protein
LALADLDAAGMPVLAASYLLLASPFKGDASNS